MRRELPPAAIVVIDEAHKWFEFYESWFASPEWQDIPIIGLSATPWAQGLGKYYKRLIIASTTKELIDGGFLAPFRVFAPAHPDLGGVRTLAGDYHEGDLGDAMDRAQLVADIVQTWVERGEGRPTFCFAVNCAHAQHIRDRFEAAGIPAAYMDARTKLDEREDIRRKFHAGEFKVVCNVGVLTTGIDWDVRCIILARPTKSEMLFVQMIGRGLRRAEGKADCLILDHSDTHSRLGFVTDIAYETLDDGQYEHSISSRKSTEVLPKECPACTFLRPAHVHVCPHCGFAPKAQWEGENQNGELVEITHARTTAQKLAGVDRKSLYAQLCWIARDRSYKPGWAVHQFKTLAGYWPNRNLHVAPEEPCDMLRSWIRSRQIAYAKRRTA
jgi:DNA repair protein RadD